MAEGEFKQLENRKFYGSITVSERGQIVIPAEARKDFNIKTGDKLLVLGDLEQGIAIVTVEYLQKMMKASANLFQMVQSSIADNPDKKGKK